MKAYFVCSWCGRTVEVGQENRHYYAHKQVAEWDIKHHARKSKTIVLSSNLENKPRECDGFDFSY